MRNKIQKQRRTATNPRGINSGVLDSSPGDQSVLQPANVSNGSPPDPVDLSRPKDATSSESALQSGHPDISGSSSFTLSRNRRSTDVKFADALIGLQALSRISSAVALEIGLVDGSILPEDVVAKLLRLGTLTLQDIFGLDQSAIDTALALLPLPPPGNNELKHMEDWLVALDGIRLSSEFMATFASFPGKNEYVAHLPEVEKIKDLATTVADWQLKVDTVLPAFKKVNITSEAKNEGEADDVFMFADTLKKGLGSIEAMANAMEAALVPLKKAKELEKSATFYEILNKEALLREKLGLELKVISHIKTPLSNTFQKAYEVKDSLKDSPHILNLQKLIETKSPSFRNSFDYSSGLPSGHADLDHLLGDCSNQWVISRVSNSSVFTENLRKVFKPFGELETALGNIEKTYATSLTDKSLLQVFRTQKNLVEMPNDLATVSATIDQIENCEKSRTSPANNLNSVATHLTSIQTLNQKVMNLPAFDYIDELKDLKTLKDLLPKDPIPADKKAAANEYLNAMKNSEKFKKVLPILEKLQTDIASLTTAITEIPTLVGTVNTGMAAVEGYHQAVAKQDHIGFFACLKDKVGDNTAFLKELIEVIQSSRLQPATLDSAKTAIGEVIKKKESLTEAVKKAESLKRDSPEVTYLQSTFDKTYKEVAKKLGMGVQGLAAVEKVSKDRKHLDPLLSMVDEILKDAKEKGLSQNHQSTLEKLKTLQEFFTKIDDFLKSMDSRRKRQVGFTGAEKYFKGAAGIPAVDIDVKILQEAIDELKKAVPTKYDAIDPALKVLEQMDLDFARFDIRNSASSLADITKFFSEYVKQLSKQVVIPPGGPHGSPSAPVPQSVLPPNAPLMTPPPEIETSTLDKMSAFMATELGIIIVYGVGTLLVLIVSLGAALIIYRCCCWQAEEPDPEEEQEKLVPVVEPPPKIIEKTKIVEKIIVEKVPMEPMLPDEPLPPPRPPRFFSGDATPPPAPPPPEEREEATQPFVSDDDALCMLRTAVEAIRSRALDGISATQWARTLLAIFEEFNKQMVVVDENDVNVKERRHRVQYCIKNTMSVITGFKNNFINSNVFHFDLNQWHAGQGPMDGTELDEKGKATKVSTCEKQYALFDQNGIKIVAKLCRNKEMKREKGQDVVVPKCAEYFSPDVDGEKIFGKYTVKTKKIRRNLARFSDKEDFTLYELEYTNSQTKKTKKIDILEYAGWPDHDAPCSARPAAEIIKFCDGYLGNVFVHCSAGIGRTGTLIAIKYGIEKCQKQKIERIDEIIGPVRAVRYGSVQSHEQVIYTFLGIARAIMTERKIPFLREFWALQWYHQETKRGTYDEFMLSDELKKEEKKEQKIQKIVDFLLEDQAKMERYCQLAEDKYKAALTKKQREEFETEKARKLKEIEDAKKAEEEKEDKKTSSEKMPSKKTSSKKSEKKGSKKSLEKKSEKKDGSKKQKTSEKKGGSKKTLEEKASKEKSKKSKEAK